MYCRLLSKTGRRDSSKLFSLTSAGENSTRSEVDCPSSCRATHCAHCSLDTYYEDSCERREGCRGPAGNAYGLNALKDGYTQEVHVGWAMELLPQVLHREVDGGVLFCGELRQGQSAGKRTRVRRTCGCCIDFCIMYVATGSPCCEHVLGAWTRYNQCSKTQVQAPTGKFLVSRSTQTLCWKMQLFFSPTPSRLLGACQQPPFYTFHDLTESSPATLSLNRCRSRCKPRRKMFRYIASKYVLYCVPATGNRTTLLMVKYMHHCADAAVPSM